MASLGQDLKRERELRGISLKEISDSTRIGLRLLQALEEDRLDVLPRRFFTKAILRSYAKSVGLDEDQVLNKFDEMHSFEEQLQYKEAREKSLVRSPRRPLNRRRIAVFALVLAAVAIAGTLLYILVFSAEEKPRLSQESPPQPITSLIETELPSRPPQLALEESRGLRLEILFAEETWLHVYADGTSVWEGIKNKGELLIVEAARQVVLNVGNAGGPHITINGQKARPLGPPGIVRTDVRITLDNYREYLVSPEQEKN